MVLNDSFLGKCLSPMLLFSLPIFKDSKYTDESENIIHSGVSNSLLSHGLQPARLLCPWNSPGKNTEVGSLSLPQGIFPTKGQNLGLAGRFFSV